MYQSVFTGGTDSTAAFAVEAIANKASISAVVDLVDLLGNIVVHLTASRNQFLLCASIPMLSP